MKTFRQLSEESQLSERYDSDLDVNKNGKLDSDDFKRLRSKKKKSDCNEDSQLDEAGRFAGSSRYSYAASNMSSHRAGIDVPNVNHKINADGDHEFKGGYQHKIIKQGDTAGLQSHLKYIHDNILGRGNMFVSHSGSKDQKVFNGGNPGVDALHKAVTAHINEETDLIESIENMSDARLKYHATKNFPHGRYTAKEIKTEHKRREKIVPNYHTVMPSLSEDYDVESMLEYIEQLESALDESGNPFKRLDSLEFQTKSKAAVDSLKGDKKERNST